MEEYRDIAGYEGFYQVSDQGNVISLQRLLPEAIERGVRAFKKHLRPGENKQGRKQVVLCRDGFVKRYQIHRLVLETFLGPCPEGLECRHLDGDHTNNVLGNLVWGTHHENMLDKDAHGTQTRGCETPAAKLTTAQVLDIRASDRTQRWLARHYGVTQATICHILAGRTWKRLL